MAHRRAGAATGVPIVLIHGFLSSTAQWDPNLEALGARHPLVLVDLPGHGASADPATIEACARDRLVDELDRIRRAEGVDRWIVCGQSLGGAIGLRYALARPDHVVGVAFTNTRAAFGAVRGSGPGGSPIPPDLTSVRDVAVHPIHAKRFDPAIKERLVAAADRVTVDTVRIVGSHRASWRSVDEMPLLRMPVLLVNGRWETRFQPCVDEARSAIADLEVVDLEGGHAINVERAADFDAAVLGWSARLGG